MLSDIGAIILEAVSHSFRYAVLTVLALAPAATAGTIDSLVGAVSQSSYESFLVDHLYTQPGDSRGSSASLGAQHDLTAAYIHSTFASFGLQSAIEPVTVKWRGVTYPAANVVGRLTGTVHPDQYFILGAHYDSVGNPGADDDASGVAGVLEAARVLSAQRFAYSIVFAAFDFEEEGCKGANQYVWTHDMSNVLGMLELDMIAYNAGGANRVELYTLGGPNPVSASVLAAMANHSPGLSTTFAGGNEGASDHGPFAAFGVNSAMLTEGAPYSPYYHTQSDAITATPYLDYAYGADITRGAVGWLAQQANPVPEPGTALLSLASAGLLVWTALPKRRRK
jgi:Zn-dependent M28 family amino/carboxypeptidase